MRSFVGSRQVGLAALVAVGIALPSCDLFIPHTDGRIVSNESVTMAYLRAYLSAQNQFKRSDFYGIGKTVYANPSDGNGFADLYQLGYPSAPRGEVFGMIDVTFADAGARNPSPKPKAGYLFADITGCGNVPYDYTVDCGLCAVPASYNRSGRNIYIIDVTGTVYQKDAAAEYPWIQTGDGVPPLKRYPDLKTLVTWTPVGWE